MMRLLFLLMLLLVAVECRRGWKNILPLDGRQECGSEFHDVQSKWLQSPLALQVRWRSADEHPADPRGAFNITVTVGAMLKNSSRNLTSLRITVGQFNRSLGRRQRSLQRRLCVPRKLARNGARPGYIMFLTPTEDLNYFKHRFLPVKNTRSNRRKIARIQCRDLQHCPKPPKVTQEVQLRGVGGAGGRSPKLICEARGRPLPLAHWLKDGEEVRQSKFYKLQYKTKSGIVTTRLKLKNYSDSAGNYTCVFRNLRGETSSSFTLTVPATVDTTKRPPSVRLLCDDSTRCLNGGTCTVDRLTKKQVCICRAGYTGTLCEKVYFQEAASFHQKQAAAAPISSAALGVVFIAVFAVLAVVLLSVCLLLYKVRRRLDRTHRRSRLSSRCDNAETQHPSNGTAALIDASTMTEALGGTSTRHQPKENQPHQQQLELHPLPDCVSTNGGQPPRLPRPLNHLRPQQPPPQPPSLGYSDLPIRPIFDYAGGLQSDSPDLRTELGRLNQLERRQQMQQPRHQQPVIMQTVEESAGGDEADAVTEALLPFPGHGQRRQHLSSS